MACPDRDAALEALAHGLNPGQQAVLEHDFEREGPLLVLAGAGTGKTAVTTRRLARELLLGADPDAVAALTFTRKAAEEMRERAAALVPDGRVPEIRTFHSLGLRVLSGESGRGWRAAGWDGPPELLTESGEAELRAAFWKERFRTDPTPPPRARELDRLAAEWGDPARLAAARPDHPLLDCWSGWDAFRRRRGRAVFSDLVSSALLALEADEGLASAWRGRCVTLLVDEYQDTDRTQYRLVRLLSAGSPRLLAVGDDDQSIYGFRGADVRNVLDWTRDNPDGRILSLTENYRCRAPVLELSNRLFPDKPPAFRKILTPGRTPSAGAFPVWRRCRDEREESAWIRARAEEHLRGGTRPEDICLLFRANREEASLRAALAGLPCSPDGTGEGIRLLTVHAAKGLEWPVVLVCGQDAPRGEASRLLPAERDEERRLFYVACTRARDHLYLTSCALRTGPDGTPQARRPLPWMRLAAPATRIVPGRWEALRARFSLAAARASVERPLLAA